MSLADWKRNGWLRPHQTSKKQLAHYRTLQVLPIILGDDFKDDADYLDTCRSKRNTVEYEVTGAASAAEADELLEFCKELRNKVILWLRDSHPDLNPFGPEDNSGQ